MRKMFGLIVGLLSGICSGAQAQQPSPDLTLLGKVKTLSAKEITSSRWSIGGETLDRDYASYDAYKSYLGPLGAKRIRIQGGWARCEKLKGQFDFTWLDPIINDALAQGVQPWLQASYGNPIYPGGGDALLAGGIPSSPEALQAWDRWVAAFVEHFKDRVNEWEIWNEPDLGSKFTATDYARFYERTARIIRKIQPHAKLIGLSLCCTGWEFYADTLLTYLEATRQLDLIDVIAFHGYKYRPEETYRNVDDLKKVALAKKPGLVFWQGENGANSVKKGESTGALRQYDWSELTQAKWNLRRMAGDMGNDIAVTNIFQISDMYYAGSDHLKGYNAKGLLKARPDLSIEKPKLSYYAYQYTASIFSNEIIRIKNTRFNTRADIFAFGYSRKNTNYADILTLWNTRLAPVEDSSETQVITFNVKNVVFKDPVYVDLITGKVYQIPAQQFIKENDNSYTFLNILIPDYPVLIAERSQIQWRP
ncbi:GH39 family glycosyl hydrolase [Flavitalea antarctica]